VNKLISLKEKFFSKVNEFIFLRKYFDLLK